MLRDIDLLLKCIPSNAEDLDAEWASVQVNIEVLQEQVEGLTQAIAMKPSSHC
jgi:hypothetical protein